MSSMNSMKNQWKIYEKSMNLINNKWKIHEKSMENPLRLENKNRLRPLGLNQPGIRAGGEGDYFLFCFVFWLLQSPISILHQKQIKCITGKIGRGGGPQPGHQNSFALCVPSMLPALANGGKPQRMNSKTLCTLQEGPSMATTPPLHSAKKRRIRNMSLSRSHFLKWVMRVWSTTCW